MIKDYVKCCNCDFIGTVDRGEDKCPSCNEEGYLAWVDEDMQEVDETDLKIGKEKLIKIIQDDKYYNFKDYFYVTFGSYNDIECAIVVINDRISLKVVVKEGDIVALGGDEIGSGGWYDIEIDYIKECLNKVYLSLA